MGLNSEIEGEELNHKDSYCPDLNSVPIEKGILCQGVGLNLVSRALPWFKLTFLVEVNQPWNHLQDVYAVYLFLCSFR